MKQVGVDVEVNRLVEQHRRSFSESFNDILRRVLPLVPVAAPPSPDNGEPELRSFGAATRTRGLWTVVVQGDRIAAGNLKSAYRALLTALSGKFPDFLSRFAEEKGRSRRFVARTPGGLYGASPHLAKDHAEPLVDGWFFDTNLSAAQVSARARIAARLCGLRYGADVKILETFVKSESRRRRNSQAGVSRTALHP